MELGRVTMMPCFANPLTFALLLLCGILLVIGAILLNSSRRERRTASGASATCESCGHLNPPGARFCARCGNPIASTNDDHG